MRSGWSGEELAAAEMGSERYPLDLFLKVITVSLETMKIVKTLPKLEIHPLDK